MVSNNSLRIFTARNRSLGQGNVFTPVCHSVHKGGGLCPSMRHRSRDRRSLSGGLSVQGVSVQGVSVQGSMSRGVSLSRGVSVREAPRTVTSRRYTSYWNAFFL